MSTWLWIFSVLWFLSAVKSALFWLYLWQLKEYHIGRFADHFRTHKGKALIKDAIRAVKLILLIGMLSPLSYWAVTLIGVLYAVEVLRLVYQRRLKLPIPTAKMILLGVVSLVVLLFIPIAATRSLLFPAWLVLADILLPVWVSLVVLLVQPFFVLVRLSTIARAKKKIAQCKNLKVVAITGSYGKTSTKEFLTTILAAKFKVLSTPRHQNSEMGIAKTILHDLNQDHQVFVAEMGAYKKGGIKLLCDMVPPSIGVVTGVNEQHLSTFGSMENLLSAEGGRELMQSLTLGGLLVINGDNKYGIQLHRHATVETSVYSASRSAIQADVWAEEISVKKGSLSFVAVSHRGNMAHVEVPLHGAYQVQNLLAAISVALRMGMSMEEISLAAQKIRPEQGGMQVQRGAYGVWVIDSSYSANPDGVLADLDYLRTFTGKKAMVMPCLIELGEKSAEIHRNIGKKIAQVCDLAIITTKDQFEMVKNAAPTVPTMVFLETPQEIFELLTTQLHADDAILLEGRVPGELITLLYGKQV